MAFHSPPTNKRFQPFSQPTASASSPPRKAKRSMNALNNNVSPKRQASDFASWFRKLIDTDRSGLCLYIADDAVLQWFGRTVKTKKKINDFLKYVMHCTNHRYMSVEPCGPFTVRGEKEEDTSGILGGVDKLDVLATPLQGDLPAAITVSTRKRARAASSSPEESYDLKRRNTKNLFQAGSKMDVDEKPINSECKKMEGMTIVAGRGDCLPSTSGSDSRNPKCPGFQSQLPRNYAEAKCVVEFSRPRNKRGANLLKWDRQCKLEMAYTEDPAYAGEYIIWTIVYSDNNKCRRNLLAEFDAVSRKAEGVL